MRSDAMPRAARAAASRANMSPFSSRLLRSPCSRSTAGTCSPGVIAGSASVPGTRWSPAGIHTIDSSSEKAGGRPSAGSPGGSADSPTGSVDGAGSATIGSVDGPAAGSADAGPPAGGAPGGDGSDDGTETGNDDAADRGAVAG